MALCHFASDLHGDVERYRRLFDRIAVERPRAVFLGGDLTSFLPPEGMDDLLDELVRKELEALKRDLADAYPAIFAILGNDDVLGDEQTALSLDAAGLWTYCHDRAVTLDERPVFGYSNVPPTPFRNKDWERYDVSRYVPPGCVSPEEGSRYKPVEGPWLWRNTIASDLERLAGNHEVKDAILLFHTPPFETNLDRAATDGKMIDFVPLDLHVGSIAVRRFIEARQPLLTLHGHIHESARITGSWRDRIGRTHLFSAAHDGPELALVRFEPEDLPNAERVLI